MIVFRPAGKKDVSLMHEFWGTELADSLLISRTDIEGSLKRLKHYLGLPYPFLIATVERTPVGFIGIHSVYNGDEGVIHYGIREKYQHLGYGTKMLKEFMIYLESTEIKLILAEILETNLSSCKMVFNCGFKYLCTHPNKLNLYVKDVKSPTKLLEFERALAYYNNYPCG